ncbi:MAG: hypothetical protein M1832_006247 [Thelocarpon impressellum]|nr:MAG: hypothetical protein M1832_006247 [Thelocarpon impressellum]
MATKLSLTDTLPLPSSPYKIPRLGFGVYKSPPDTCVESCLAALRAGYRHIDTAQFYGNEAAVGAAVRQSGLPRAELFLTTKIMRPAADAEATYAKLLASVDKLGGEEGDGYVDLFLIHSASGGAGVRKTMWTALERLHAAGRARAIGVSNYGVAHLEELHSYATVWPPAVNQIELHPFCQQRQVAAHCAGLSIVLQAYSPLVRNRRADDATLVALAEKYATSTPQLLIRYALQKGWVPLPKSDTPARIAANADVYGFAIEAGDMDTLDALDEGSRGAIVHAVTD